MILELTHAAATATQVLAESDSDAGAIGLLFLLAGPAFYLLIFFRYRNTDKRHKHESETTATMLDVQADDRLVRSMKGLSSSTMSGANNRAVRARRK